MDRRTFLQALLAGTGMAAVGPAVGNLDRMRDMIGRTSLSQLVEAILTRDFPDARVSAYISPVLITHKETGNRILQPLEYTNLAAHEYESVPVASVYKIILAIIYLAIRPNDGTFGDAEPMIYASDNDATGKVLEYIFAELAASGSIQGNNPIEFFNNLLEELITAIYEEYPDIVREPIDGVYGLYNWGNDSVTDESKRSLEPKGPCLPTFLLSMLMQDLQVNFYSGTSGAVKGTLLRLFPQLEENIQTLPTRLKSLLSGADWLTQGAYVFGINQEVHKEFDAGATALSISVEKIGQIGGVLALEFYIAAHWGDSSYITHVLLQFEVPSLYTNATDTLAMMTLMGKAENLVFQYIDEILYRLLPEEAYNTLNLRRIDSPWPGDISMDLLTAGVVRITFDSDPNWENVRLKSLQEPVTGYFLPRSKFNGAVPEDTGAINMLINEEGRNVRVIPIRFSPYSPEWIRALKLIDWSQFNLDLTDVGKYSLDQQALNESPKEYLTQQLSALVTYAQYSGTDFNTEACIDKFLSPIQLTDLSCCVLPIPSDPEAQFILNLVTLFPDFPISKLFIDSLDIRSVPSSYKEEIKNALNAIGGYRVPRAENGYSSINSLLHIDRPVELSSLAWGGEFILSYLFSSRYQGVDVPDTIDMLQLELVIHGKKDWDRIKNYDIIYHEAPGGTLNSIVVTGGLIVKPNPNSDRVEIISFNVRALGEIVDNILAENPDAEIYLPDLNFLSVVVKLEPQGDGTLAAYEDSVLPAGGISTAGRRIAALTPQGYPAPVLIG